MSSTPYPYERSTRRRRAGRPATFLLLWLAAAGASAEVYKWVDEQGEVHYGDRPPVEGARADTLALPPAPSRDAEQVEREFMRQRLLDAFEAERREAEQARTEAKAAKRDRELRCARLAEQLARFERANIVYNEGDDGERIYMSDEERRRAARQARDWMTRHCDR